MRNQMRAGIECWLEPALVIDEMAFRQVIADRVVSAQTPFRDVRAAEAGKVEEEYRTVLTQFRLQRHPAAIDVVLECDEGRQLRACLVEIGETDDLGIRAEKGLDVFWRGPGHAGFGYDIDLLDSSCDIAQSRVHSGGGMEIPSWVGVA